MSAAATAALANSRISFAFYGRKLVRGVRGTMRPSPAWFSARPNDAYPDSDEEEREAFRHGVERSAPPGPAYVQSPRLKKPYRRIIAVLLCVPVAVTVFLFFLRKYELRGVPAGLWSKNGVLHAGLDPFHIKGISWYGMEGTTHCFEGLDKNSLSNVLALLKEHRFNAIRVPIALDNFLRDPVVEGGSISTFANPNLKLVTYRELLRIFVKRAADHDILVLLDLHRLEAKRWPTDGLWYSDSVAVESVIGAWERLATDFASEWNVLGADIYNEVCFRAATDSFTCRLNVSSFAFD